MLINIRRGEGGGMGKGGPLWSPAMFRPEPLAHLRKHKVVLIFIYTRSFNNADFALYKVLEYIL